MAEIFDIFGREFVSVIRHVHSLPGLRCCFGDSQIEADYRTLLALRRAGKAQAS